MTDRSMLLQRQIEALLEHHLPQHSSPYFDRGAVVTRLLYLSHVYALELAQEINRELVVSMSQPIILCADPEVVERVRKELTHAPQDPSR